MLRLMVRWDGDRYGAKEDWEDEQRRLGAFEIDVIKPSSSLRRHLDNVPSKQMWVFPKIGVLPNYPFQKDFRL